MKLQMREYRRLKAITDKNAEKIRESLNKSGCEWTIKDWDNLGEKLDAQNIEVEKLLSPRINNTYVFKIIDIICNGLDELNRIHGKNGQELQEWKNTAEQIKRRIRDSQVSAFNFGFEQGELIVKLEAPKEKKEDEKNVQ